MPKQTQTVHQTYQTIQRELAPFYPNQEAKALTLYVFKELFQYSTTDVFTKSNELIPSSYFEQLDFIIEQLKNYTPIQYIFGAANFSGFKFKVNSSTLIPRPETEELIVWIDEILQQYSDKQLSILDIGTGSGCIPITLQQLHSKHTYYGCDISDGALSIAQENNKILGSNVRFFRIDILNETPPEQEFQIVISNPPYVRFSEQELMKPNVLKYEPHSALFVPDNDPLIFYRTILQKFKNQHPIFFFEINEALKEDLTKLLLDLGFKFFEFKKDITDKYRMLRVMS